MVERSRAHRVSSAYAGCERVAADPRLATLAPTVVARSHYVAYNFPCAERPASLQGGGLIKALHHHSRVHPRRWEERAQRRLTSTWQGVLMGAIALVLLIWLSLNVALVVFRWLHLDHLDDVPNFAPTSQPRQTTQAWPRVPNGAPADSHEELRPGTVCGTHPQCHDGFRTVYVSLSR